MNYFGSSFVSCVLDLVLLVLLFVNKAGGIATCYARNGTEAYYWGSPIRHALRRPIQHAVIRDLMTSVLHRDSAVRFQQGCLLTDVLIRHGSRPPVLICVLVSN
jgi:hypothetical protein